MNRLRGTYRYVTIGLSALVLSATITSTSGLQSVAYAAAPATGYVQSPEEPPADRGPKRDPVDLDAGSRRPDPGRPANAPQPGGGQTNEPLRGHPTNPPNRPEDLPNEPPQRQANRPTSVPNQVIVQFRNQDAFQTDHGHRQVGQVLEENAGLNARLLRVANVPQALDALRRNPNVQSAEANSVASGQFDPNDTYYPYQWHPRSWSAGRGSNLRGAWNLTRGTSARIVIVDTGVDWTHPDFAGKYPSGYNFAESNYDWYDCNGHGTAVAGVAAAASNNAQGVAGADMVAPLYVAKIVSGCAGTASYWTMANAIYYSSGWAGTRVINVSFGGASYSAYLNDAVQVARGRNVIVVAAAGNSNTNAASYPAAIAGVVGVGATTQTGSRAAFSNWGSPNVDVSAPGVNILTTRSGYVGGGYAYYNGTSFASPLLAGIAGLTVSRYPTASEGTIRYWLQWGAYNPECGWNCYTNNYGYGVTDAYWAAY